MCHYRSQDVVDPAVHCRRVPTHLSRDRAAGAAAGAEPPGVFKAADLPCERHRPHGVPHVRLRGVGATRVHCSVCNRDKVATFNDDLIYWKEMKYDYLFAVDRFLF